MLLLRDSDVEDNHLTSIREMWARVDDQSEDSILEVVQRILARQIEWSREPIDLQAIAPEVGRILTEIRELGIRAAMESYI